MRSCPAASSSLLTTLRDGGGFCMLCKCDTLVMVTH